jgi:hypothetical protein
MREALTLMAAGKIDPAVMVTHIGGIDSVIDTVLDLPNTKGAKKLIYTGLSMPLVAFSEFEELGKTDSLYKELDRLVKANNGLWSKEAEDYLLANGKPFVG